nr:uncharacterized protein LOC121469586 [Taeniopygia guttata]
MEILGNLVHPLKSILVTGALPASAGAGDDKLPAHPPGLSVPGAPPAPGRARRRRGDTGAAARRCGTARSGMQRDAAEGCAARRLPHPQAAVRHRARHVGGVTALKKKTKKNPQKNHKKTPKRNQTKTKPKAQPNKQKTRRNNPAEFHKRRGMGSLAFVLDGAAPAPSPTAALPAWKRAGRARHGTARPGCRVETRQAHLPSPWPHTEQAPTPAQVLERPRPSNC